MALQSGKNRFRLLAGMNGTIWIFMWCDEENNFLGMSSSNMDEYKVDYTFDELSSVIDNAQKWLDKAKAMDFPAENVTEIYVMAI